VKGKQGSNMAASTLPFPTVHDAGQDLARKTVCIKVERHRLGNSKKVNSSQVEVDTDKSLLHISKRLYDSKEYTAVGNLDGEITRYLEETCLPFERGIHLCPVQLLKQVDAKMREFAEARRELVEAFVAVYPELCKSAPGRLRALHNPLDYPAVEQVRAAFTFTWRYVSFGVPDQLREISGEIWAEEREKASRIMTEAVSEVQLVMRIGDGGAGSAHARPAAGRSRWQAHPFSPDNGLEIGCLLGQLRISQRHRRCRAQGAGGAREGLTFWRDREGSENDS
jgi:hypothetical protein